MTEPLGEQTPLLTGSIPDPEGHDIPPPQSTPVHANGAVNGRVDEPAPVRMSALLPPLVIGIFLAAMDQTVVVSSYASIGNELQSLQNTSWIATAYMLTLTSFQPLYGKMSDIFGRKSCLIFAYTLFGLGTLWCGLSTSMSSLIVARAFTGVGGGGMTTVVSIIVSDVVSLRTRGTWQGALNIVFATGAAIGAPLGGFLSDGIGWRWAFFIQVPLILIAIIVVGALLKLPSIKSDDKQGKLARIDFGGALALVLTVFFLLLGLDRGGNQSYSSPVAIGSLVAFVVLLALFITIESRWAKEPFAPPKLIVEPGLLAAYLCNFFGFASSLSLIYYISLYFQAVLQYSAAEAGLHLLPNILGGVIGSLGGGLLMQKTGKYYFLTVGAYSCLLIGVLLICLLTGTIVRSEVGIGVGLATMAFGNGIGVTSTLVSLIANVPPTDQAVVTAVSYLFRSLGAVVGVSVGGTIIQTTLRRELRARLTSGDTDTIARRVRESLAFLEELDPKTRSIVRSSYGDAIRGQFWMCLAIAAMGLLCSFFIREKELTRR